jgi:hypothetical protein
MKAKESLDNLPQTMQVPPAAPPPRELQGGGNQAAAPFSLVQNTHKTFFCVPRKPIKYFKLHSY